MENFLSWWNHIPEYINPNIVTIGSFQIRYYGLMYVVAFAIVYLLVLYRLTKLFCVGYFRGYNWWKVRIRIILRFEIFCI
jgi:prolipoprotein diacylglyceryltransferase